MSDTVPYHQQPRLRVSAAGVAVEPTCPRCHQRAASVDMEYDTAGYVLSLTWGHVGTERHTIATEELVRLGILDAPVPEPVETTPALLTDEEMDEIERALRDFDYDEGGLWTAETARRLVAEVRRLRADASRLSYHHAKEGHGCRPGDESSVRVSPAYPDLRVTCPLCVEHDKVAAVLAPEPSA